MAIDSTKPKPGAPKTQNAATSTSSATPAQGTTGGAPKPGATLEDLDEATEETTLVSALSLLNQMHQKLILLRESIPHMVHPIMKASNYPTPEKLFDEFSKRTLKASEDLVDFTTLVSDEKWVFEKAAASRRDNGDNGEVKRWKSSAPVPVYLKDLVDASSSGGGSGSSKHAGKEGEAKKKEEEERKRREAEKDREREVAIDEVQGVESDEVRREIVEAFKKEHGDIEVTYEDDGKTIKVALPKHLNLIFSVELPSASAESNRYTVTLPVSSYLHILVLRSITTRPNAGSLKYLLDMLATYKSIYQTKCNHCSKLTNGPKADLPVVRRLKKTVTVVKKELMEIDEHKAGQAEGSKGAPKIKTENVKGKNPNNDKDKSQERNGPVVGGKGVKESGEGQEELEEELVKEFWVAHHESCVK
ncbi:hypothetical protein TWF694_008918 [Orbilia ellipsospora]|uniref:Uncharacterized protein n=1 Tax=Orbilia ellipsospora TaxID=2528407 RepID=A0AAV9XDV7_9PEZI